MDLEMVKGKESSLIVEDVVTSIQKKGFLSDSYAKALHALCDYIENSEEITKELSGQKEFSVRNSILYRSSHNIIAFSGRRGSGKTSAMLSFSNTLGNPERIDALCRFPRERDIFNGLKNRYFMVLDPIDPTSLERNQSILSVVLSRLLNKAEEFWNRRIDFYGSFQDKEGMKTKILFLARQCLNGISAIKSKKDVPDELSDLQKVGDSSILKMNLYHFVNLVLQFSQAGSHVPEGSGMLILQIDDTDCQIGQGYEVMEDIRKYLTIPNVLILMATDTRLLRKVLVQHYIEDFKYSMDEGFIGKAEIKSLGEKYMAKLMPPTQVIHLPNIDEFIRDRIDLIHLYYYKNGLREEHLLDMHEEGGYKEYEFQSVILRYIYRKTRLVFVSHDAYANNIIPTTLRGLAYLLNLLSSMEDIPDVDFSAKPGEKSDTDYLAERMKVLLPVWEKNLNLFEEYFMHDWIQAKLPYDMLGIMEELAEQVPDQRISFLIKRLSGYYGEKNQNDPLLSMLEITNQNGFFYQNLDELFRILQGTKGDSAPEKANRRSEDFYFIFAVRTLLSIKNNRDVLKVKRKLISNWDNTDNSPIVFNYLKEKTSLPTGFYLESVALYGYHLVLNHLVVDKETDSFYFFNTIDTECFNLTGGIVEWLNPQQAAAGLSQREIYEAQELAVLVAANCDVQEKVRKSVARKAKELPAPKEADSLVQAVERGLALMQNGIAEINQGMFARYGLKDGQNAVWKISESSKQTLEKYDTALAIKAKQELPGDGIGAGASDKSKAPKAYPKFVSPLSERKSKPRNKQFQEEVINYEENLLQSISDEGKKIDDESRKYLNELRSFVPDYAEGYFQNKGDFDQILENLNASLDRLFSAKDE